MDNVTILTDRFDRALLYATLVHGGQVRKGTSIPYVAHLLAAAATVLEYGGDEELAIAALLHDSVEDQGGKARLEDVRNRFGERVARIVEACSDSLADTAKGERKAHWQERKEAYLAHLQTADEDILRVSLADKVHNARSILRDLRKSDIGEAVWARFSQPKKQTLWYYRSLAVRFCERLPGQLSDELREIVDVLEASGPKLTSAGVPWSEVPEFARPHVAWIDGRHGSAPSPLPPINAVPVPEILNSLPCLHEDRPRGSRAMIDAAGARARLRDVRPGGWLISPYTGWKWAKFPNGEVGWLPANIGLPASLEVTAHN